MRNFKNAVMVVAVLIIATLVACANDTGSDNSTSDEIISPECRWGTYYPDADNDGLPDSFAGDQICVKRDAEQPAGMVLNIHAGNTLDPCLDVDRDGSCFQDDCNDNDPEVSPFIIDDDSNGQDDNCDGWADNERVSLGRFDGYIEDEFLGSDNASQPVYHRYHVFDDGIIVNSPGVYERDSMGVLIFEVKDIEWKDVQALEFQVSIAETIDQTECFIGRKGLPGKRIINAWIEIASSQKGTCKDLDGDQGWDNFMVIHDSYPDLPADPRCILSLAPPTISKLGAFSDSRFEVQAGNTLSFKLERDHPNFSYIEKSHYDEEWDYDDFDYEVQYLVLFFTVEDQCDDWMIRVEDGENTYGTGNVPVLRISYKE